MPVDNLSFRIEVEGNLRGAYFRKVRSTSHVDHRGIRGVGILPLVSFDPDRQYVSGQGLDHFTTGPLDRPSVYMGGHAAGREVDAGLTWDRVYDPHGRATYTDDPLGTDSRDPAHRFAHVQVEGQPALEDGTGSVVAVGQDDADIWTDRLRPNFAFRPFWRTTNEGGNRWHNPRVGSADNVYFYPGERFTMTVQEAGPNQVRMGIRLEDEPTTEHFTTTFRQERFGVGRPQSFKRVNSIDQFTVDDAGRRVGLEGEDVLPTRTTATGGGWDEVFILGPSGVKHRPVAGPDFTEVRGGDVAPRYDEIFRRSGWNAQGGERLDITPLPPEE